MLCYSLRNIVLCAPFPFDVLGEMWNSIVSVPDRCLSIRLRGLHNPGSVEPAHEIMVLVTQATSEGSGEPVHPRSLARAFAVRTHEVWK